MASLTICECEHGISHHADKDGFFEPCHLCPCIGFAGRFTIVLG